MSYGPNGHPIILSRLRCTGCGKGFDRRYNADSYCASCTERFRRRDRLHWRAR